MFLDEMGTNRPFSLRSYVIPFGPDLCGFSSFSFWHVSILTSINRLSAHRFTLVYYRPVILQNCFIKRLPSYRLTNFTNTRLPFNFRPTWRKWRTERRRNSFNRFLLGNSCKESGRVLVIPFLQVLRMNVENNAKDEEFMSRDG